jgi:copper transport protein
MSRHARLWFLALAVIVVPLAAAPAASAHAIIIASTPANDAVLASSPKSITLTFNEPVETQFGAVLIYDGEAKQASSGKVTQPDKESVAVTVDDKLPNGTYTVTWRVISGDTHPISGAFVFHVGAPGKNATGVATEVLGSGAAKSVRVLFTIDRFLRFALILLIAGGLTMLVTALTSAREDIKRRLAWAIFGCAMALVLVSFAGIGLQGAYAGGFGALKMFDPGLWPTVLDSAFGEIWLLQAVVASLIAVLAALIGRRPSRGGSVSLTALTLAPAAVLLVLPAFSGHARVEGGLSILADTVHVAAAAAWTGGLAFVLAALILSGPDRWRLASRAVPRFSQIAVVSVGVLLLSGVTNGYLQIRELHGLWDTGYGVLLLVKTGLVLPVLALGAYNNRYVVGRLRDAIASVTEQRRFLKAVAVELSIVTAVVAVTSALVVKPPAKAALTMAAGPWSTTTEMGPMQLEFHVAPAEAGANTLSLSLVGDDDRPADVDEAKIVASLPSKNIGPLRYTAHRAEPGHYAAHGATFPVAGDWTVRIEVRRGEFDAYEQTLTMPIRAATAHAGMPGGHGGSGMSSDK